MVQRRQHANYALSNPIHDNQAAHTKILERYALPIQADHPFGHKVKHVVVHMSRSRSIHGFL